jgi:iron complex outermembrane receptor protein
VRNPFSFRGLADLDADAAVRRRSSMNMSTFRGRPVLDSRRSRFQKGDDMTVDPSGRRTWMAALGICLLLAPGRLALAQQPAAETQAQKPAAEPSPPSEERPKILEEITVTAQKREENIQEVPLSVTTFDPDELALLTSGGADVKALSARVPSLLLESSFGRAFPRFYIRGLGNTDFDLNASQPVSMVVDDVVLENPIVKGMPLFDLERTEVLRGPQGTLFGRNTPAGIVKFDTRKPSKDFDGFARASYGTYNNVDIKAAVGGRLTDTLSARVSGLYQSQSDWIDNTFTGKNDALGGQRTWAGRLQLLWEPTEKFHALANVHGWDLDGTARIFRANILQKGTDELVDGYEQDKVAQDGLNEQKIRSFGGVLKLDYQFGKATLTSVTGYETLDKMYSRGDIDGGYGAVYAPPSGPGLIPFPSESADGLPKLDQFTQELRLASNTKGRWDWLLGFYYFDESLKAETFSYNSLAPGNPQEGYAFQTQDATSWAAFASLDFRPTDRWALKGGLRYTTDQKDFSAERPDPTFQLPTVQPIQVSTDADLVTWDLSATYKATGSVNLYSRVGTGFRAPSIQGRILFCADFEGGTNPATNCVSVAHEEKIISGEVGVKTQLARKLRLNVDGFLYQVDGQQIVAVGGQYNIATLLNADKTDGYGFEADLDYAPSSDWLFTLGASYNHTEIDDPNLVVSPCGGGCTITNPIVDGSVRVDGNPLPHAPKWIFSGIVDYRHVIGQGVVKASTDWAYHSEKSFFLYQSKEFRGDSFELGARVSYAFQKGRFEIAAFGRNLLDEVIVQNGIDFDNLTGMTNEPRTIGFELVTKF